MSRYSKECCGFTITAESEDRLMQELDIHKFKSTHQEQERKQREYELSIANKTTRDGTPGRRF